MFLSHSTTSQPHSAALHLQFKPTAPKSRPAIRRAYQLQIPLGNGKSEAFLIKSLSQERRPLPITRTTQPSALHGGCPMSLLGTHKHMKNGWQGGRSFGVRSSST